MKKNKIQTQLTAIIIAFMMLSSTSIAFAKNRENENSHVDNGGYDASNNDHDNDHDDHGGYGGHHEKKEICHKGKSIEVEQSAIAAHLGHGDKLGECEKENKYENKGDKQDNNGKANDERSSFRRFFDSFFSFFHR